MKRGLKGFRMDLHLRGDGVTTIAPMKRGLKATCRAPVAWIRTSYNHCPDEKGTESGSLRPFFTAPHGYNHCPDEKGTESLFHRIVVTHSSAVTTIAPMKRGLKVNVTVPSTGAG